jgi:hypothetical protein
MVERLLSSVDLPPSETGVRLVPHELLLIDWVLSGASRIIPGADTVSDFMEWDALRSRLWTLLSPAAGYLEGQDAHYMGLSESALGVGRYLELDVSEARMLLSITPTTFRWGTAPDCGFSLKLKLHLFIEGVYHDPERDKDKAQAPGDPTGVARDKPAD